MGVPLLIDTHDRQVDDEVWGLYQAVIGAAGPVATLIEWDTDIPSWDALQREAHQAESVMREFDRAGARRAASAA